MNDIGLVLLLQDNAKDGITLYTAAIVVGAEVFLDPDQAFRFEMAQVWFGYAGQSWFAYSDLAVAYGQLLAENTRRAGALDSEEVLYFLMTEDDIQPTEPFSAHYSGSDEAQIASEEVFSENQGFDLNRLVDALADVIGEENGYIKVVKATGHPPMP